jgi:hypothetical protein
VSDQNFRGDLNRAFDNISGEPSPALSDRVRSSIAQAPEARGPYWIAAVAACIMAALIVGVLVVANACGHAQCESFRDAINAARVRVHDRRHHHDWVAAGRLRQRHANGHPPRL